MQDIHFYHYHYLYSYDIDSPKRIIDTKIEYKNNCTHYHHHVYTILHIHSSNKPTISKPTISKPTISKKQVPTPPIKGNIYELSNNDKDQAIKGILSLKSNVKLKIEKPVILLRDKIKTQHAQRMAIIISHNAVKSCSKIIQDMESVLNIKIGTFTKNNISINDRVVINGRKGRVVLRFKRPGRQVRWRVEWDDTRERTSFLGNKLKHYIKRDS
jgi:hypothetical protein